MKAKKNLLIASLASLALLIFFLLNTDFVKRETAKIMQVEFIPNQYFNIEKTKAFAQKDSIYADFRNKCRFHFQTIGIAKLEDSSYVFLISEPPAFIDKDTILNVFKKFNTAAEIKTHKVGYDGWIKDIVICVGKATAENVTNLIKHLNKLLYLSDYKSFAIDLPLHEEREYYASQKLNYRISLAEINQWFIEDAEVFIDFADTVKKLTVPDIMAAKKTGVFYSLQPGFVIWSINKKQDIQQQKEVIRKFALDADLILGAVSDSAILVIIGRERESSVMELPPLNVETILLIASIKDGELSQSLDINDLLAGKMQNDKDWCPTYLSPQLEHTEFGHLLTITDVLLKDWSENGTLQYENYNYPKPAHYPFDRPLFSKLGLNELVYNWNTANTMFAYDYNGINLYALNRTGSLPVSYFNSQANYISIGHSYENTAYNYFSNLCNTDLIRVVQYTSLYQLFIDNDIVNAGDTINYAPANKPYLLASQVKKLLTAIKNLSAKEIDSISEGINHHNYEKYYQLELLKEINQWEANNNKVFSKEQREEIIENTQSESRKNIYSDLLSMQARLGNMDEKEYDNLCNYLSYPRGKRLSNAALHKIIYAANKMSNTIYKIGKPNLHFFGMNLNGIKNYYAAALKNSSAPWIKTPSLVVSYNTPRLTGGHNLSSKIRRINSINADKAIVASGRPQEVNKQYEPSSPTPKTTGSKPKTQSTAKPKATAPKAPARKRSDVISTAQRSHRGL